jgi:hypothetical protein
MTSAVLRPIPQRARTLADFRDIHRGETIIVCGCGESLNLLEHPERFTTIGVNDVGRRLTPDYLVVVNPRSQFTGDRFRYVESSAAKAVFTQLSDLGVQHPNIVRFRLGRYGGTDWSDPGVLHYTRNSPYVALCLAVHMGARCIGLIGVDFTEHHFFARTGTHSLARRFNEIDAEYARLAASCRSRDIDVVNLSPTSRLTGVRKGSLAELTLGAPAATAPQSQRALRIVSYATTPVAGVPAILARCIAARTPHASRCLWATRSYGNGVIFDGDLEWTADPRGAEAALDAADVVIAHNGRIDPRHDRFIAGRPVLTLAHNYMWNVDRRFEKAGMPALVVGQYQATLPEFAGWTVVPNPIPTWEEAYTPGAKPDVVTICYTPSGRHERYPPGHRLYWHAKGYETTMRVLDRLAATMPVRLEILRDGQVSHADSLAMKRRSHIVIDECVTGSYHRNSLEGLAVGCVVVNGVGLLPGVADVLRLCAPGADRLPFVFSDLAGLEEGLRRLVERGPDSLAEEGRGNRVWMERHWDFSSQWERVWAQAIDGSRPARQPRRAIALAADAGGQRAVTTPRPSLEEVSVIVPHAGAERLPLLEAALSTLRTQRGVGEIIVVELGATPVAQEVAGQWADKHVIVEHAGAFERARALNAGQPVAQCDFILWHDNDLLVPPEFVSRALSELRDRGLDYLTPCTSVRYLSESDSRAVMQGVRPPEDCTAVNVLRSSGRGALCSGGIGLVARAFVERYGGYLAGFRGWGGEDNAWNHKVALLGRSAVTNRQDQHVHHLYHRASGGYSFEAASGGNPHYAENLALLRRVCAVRDRSQFIRQFPPSAPAAGRLTLSRRQMHAPLNTELPIWAYWEGPCPPWIRACQRTIARHAPGLRMLTPESFDRLRDQDRDIDLSRLHAPHRADYVRAFLLRRYGGLWIDADCILLRSPLPVLELLGKYDFAGHRERSGLISNGFIAARPDSRIASSFYDRICQALRSRKPLGWTSIGSDPLTAVVATDSREWHELPCERIQPICWSHPEEFFADRPTDEHERAFDSEAMCYMMSNTAIRKYIAAHPAANLLNERTFFSFLIGRALGATTASLPAVLESAAYESIFASHVDLNRRQRSESLSGPGSSLDQTRQLRERLPAVLEQLGVRSLLDAPCGDLNWMRHVRLPVDRYIGVDLLDELISENERRFASAQRRFVRADVIRDALPRADAIFCRDLLGHLSFDDIRRALANFERSGATYLLTTTFTKPRPNQEIVTGGWRTLNLTLPPFDLPAPLGLIDEKCTEAGGVFDDKSIGVWRLADASVSAL